MKAKKFPKINIPDDLYDIEKLLDELETVQDQIDFLKYVKNEIQICFELTDTDVYDLDMLEYQEIENAEKIIDKKIEFYEDISNSKEQMKKKIGVIKEIKSLSDKFNEIDFEKKTEFLGKVSTALLGGEGNVTITLNEQKKLEEGKNNIKGRKNYEFFSDYSEIEAFVSDFNSKKEIYNYLLWILHEAKEVLLDIKGCTFVTVDNEILWMNTNEHIVKLLNNINKTELLKLKNEENIIGEMKHLLNWFKEGVEFELLPKLKNRIEYLKNYSDDYDEESREKDITTGEQKNKKPWRKNKSEFARFVNEEYERNNEDYKSLRDASNKLFDEYEFEDKNWTKEKCYDLVRQT